MTIEVTLPAPQEVISWLLSLGRRLKQYCYMIGLLLIITGVGAR